jgi:hypothetical protein
VTEHTLIVRVDDPTDDGMYVNRIRNFLSVVEDVGKEIALLTEAEKAALIQAVEMTLLHIKQTADRFARAPDPHIRSRAATQYEPFITALEGAAHKLGDPFITRAPDDAAILTEGDRR